MHLEVMIRTSISLTIFFHVPGNNWMFFLFISNSFWFRWLEGLVLYKWCHLFHTWETNYDYIVVPSVLRWNDISKLTRQVKSSNLCYQKRGKWSYLIRKDKIILLLWDHKESLTKRGKFSFFRYNKGYLRRASFSYVKSFTSCKLGEWRNPMSSMLIHIKCVAEKDMHWHTN